jgi:hypothetical protein
MTLAIDDDNVTYDFPTDDPLDDELERKDLWKFHLVYGLSLLAILLFFLIRSVVLAKVSLIL